MTARAKKGTPAPVAIPEEDEWIEYPAWTKKGYMEAREGDGVILARPTHARGTVQKQSVPTLTTTGSCGTGTVVRDGQRLRIRQLTPRECWRLMGQTDEAFDKAAASTVKHYKNGRVSGPSKSALYKAAGNSIVVDPLADIFDAMYHGYNWTDPYPVEGEFDPKTASVQWMERQQGKTDRATARANERAVTSGMKARAKSPYASRARRPDGKWMFEDYPPEVQQAIWCEVHSVMAREWKGWSADDVAEQLGMEYPELGIAKSGTFGSVSFDPDDPAAIATVSALGWDDSYWLDVSPSAERYRGGSS